MQEKKDGWSEGWMGGALAWHQSQLWIGCCPGNGTSDLIYPLAHPRRTCTLLSPMHPSFAAHTSAVTLLGVRAGTLLLLLLVPFFFILTLYKCGHLLTKQVRESSKATLLAAVVLPGIVRQRSENKTRHRLQSCTLVHLYCGQ